jgi:hypothetical protein
MDKIQQALRAAMGYSAGKEKANEGTSLGGGTGGPGVSAQPFASPSAPTAREEDGSLRGLPRKVGAYQASVHTPAVKVAEDYMRMAGLPYNPPNAYARVNPDRARRIAAEYDRMPHDPSHPETKAAYDAMARETLAQYEAMLRAGMKVEFNPPGVDPYNGNPRAMTEDVRKNNHMWVFPTNEGFGSSDADVADNPLLGQTPYEISGKPAVVNDIFRAVHDYFGHVKEGVGFRHDGEENAWRAHSAMYSPLARRAMTTETRGQNSWVNFGPHGENNRTAKSEDTHYADQKIGLSPDWVVNEGAGDDFGDPDAIKKAGGGSIDDVDPEMVRKALAQVGSPFSDDPGQVKRALDIANQTHRMRSGNEWEGQSYFGHKGPMAASEVTGTVEPIPGASTKDPVKTDWESIYNKYKGGNMLNLGGDRSRLGRLTHINGKKLAWPVDLHAGPEYMLEPNEGAAWANAGTQTKKIQKTIKQLSDTGPVIGAYTPMGPKTVDSSFQMMDTILSQIAADMPDKKAIKQFDKNIRSGAYVEGDTEKAKASRLAESERMGGWPGLSDPWAAREWLRTNKIPGTVRSLIVKHLDKAGWHKSGFPHIGMTRAAITNPELISSPGNMIGYRVAELTPGSTKPSAFAHNTYPGVTKGSYVGDVPMVQRQYAMPDVMDKLLSKRYGAGEDVVLHPYSPSAGGRSGFRKVTEEQRQVQPINQRMLDSIMLGIERQKKYGLKTGGKAVAQKHDAKEIGTDAVQNAVNIARQLKRGRP